MSGGHFDYNQGYIKQIVEDMAEIVSDPEKQKLYEISPEILKEMKTAVGHLMFAAIYTQRIDWFISGDDGEESFHRRLKEELTELKRVMLDDQDS